MWIPLLSWRPRPATHPSIRLAHAVQVTPVDDGMVLLDGRRGTLYHVNRAGEVIITALTDDGDSTETAAEVAVTAVVTRYGITEARARADVTSLLEQLRDRGLVAR